MKRDVYTALLAWRNSSHRKPLILRGARQTGKTFLLREFGSQEYQSCHYFNFEEDSRLASLFSGDLKPARIIRDLSLFASTTIRPGDDLIIFDEIQACNEALNSLKYFNESANGYHIAAAGSLLGIRLSKPKSFPVGKVDFLDLYPMSFFEFLDALGGGHRQFLEGLTELSPIAEGLHQQLIGMLRQYYLIGGMPEVVARCIEDPDLDPRTIQRAILDAYSLDFAKHAPSSDIPKLSIIWNSLPAQLARENKKFLFSVAKSGARAREYENALSWLIDAGLVHRACRIKTPQLPVAASEDAGAFKIYSNDVGLLGALAKLPGQLMSEDQSLFTGYHGAFVENYVAQTLVGLGANLHYWKNTRGTAELDFIVQHASNVLPLEAKAGVNVKAKSLAFYQEKFRPALALRTSMRNLRLDSKLLNIPLYALPTLQNFVNLGLEQRR